jgi:hypothetical protein
MTDRDIQALEQVRHFVEGTEDVALQPMHINDEVLVLQNDVPEAFVSVFEHGRWSDVRRSDESAAGATRLASTGSGATRQRSER